MTDSPRAGRRKVVLYNPNAVFFTMPLALIAIGSALDPTRYEVVIVDGRLEDDPEAAVAVHLDDALCLGVTVLTGAPIRDALRISRFAKSQHPDLPVVWGGWHPSLFGRECFDEPSVDVTVQAQGEDTFAEIVDRLDRGESLDGCAGCWYRPGVGESRAADAGSRRPGAAPAGQPRHNGARPMRDINEFPPHDYSLVPIERYFDLKAKRQLDYISSQGCFFRCAFCADPFVFERRWKGFEPERVGAEIEALWRRWRFGDVNFQDETFFTYPKRVEAIADEFIRRELPISWAATMRADQCERLSDAALERCRRSGLRRLLIGVEAGSEEMLRRIRKDITLDQIFAAAERCRRLGIRVQFPFIVGFPDESDESFNATLDVAKRLRAMHPRFEAHVFYFKPYPGSAITQEAVDNGYSLPATLEDWADFDFIGSAGPWVTPDRHRTVERFKFYQRLAWDDVPSWKRPAQWLARWRCRTDRYGLPVEKLVSEALSPPPRLA